ncbi:MAG: hypothetical protein QXZ28_04950 [Candidatus Methanomethylicaceae archaeon]
MDPVTLAILVGSLISAGVGIWGVSRQNKANKELAQQAQQHEIDMWNMSNQYNNPQSQMNRLTNAGLNPNLVYGSGNVTGNQSAPPPKAHRPDIKNELENLDLMGAMRTLGQYSDIRKNAAITDATLTKRKLDEQKIATEQLNQLLKTKDAKYKDFITHRGKTLLPYQTDRAKKDIEALDNLIRLRAIEANEKQLSYELNQKLKPYGLTTQDSYLFRAPILGIQEAFKDENRRKFNLKFQKDLNLNPEQPMGMFPIW